MALRGLRFIMRLCVRYIGYGCFILLALQAPLSAQASFSHFLNEESAKEASFSLLLNDRFAEDARDAIDLLYDRDFDASLEKMEHWKVRYPDHPLWLLWEALDAWWPVLVDLENTSYDTAFLDISNEVITICDDLLDENDDHLDARVIRSIMYGQIARHHSNRHRWYRSFRNARRALRDFFKVEETHPDIPDLHFGIGMYRYFSAFLIDEYPLTRPLRWMLPRGDRDEGLSYIKKAAENSIFLEPEALFFLGHIYLHFERKPDIALDYLNRLYHTYPNNSFYRRLYIRSLYQLEHYDQALELISESLNRWDSQEYEEHHEVKVMKEDLYTIRGQIHYKSYQTDSAQSDFHNALEIAETLGPYGQRSNMIISLFYLGEINLRNGNVGSARLYFRRAATPDIDHPYVKQSREALVNYNLE